MAYIQRNIPNSNKEYNFSLTDFSGGLNNRSEVLNDNEASDLINMMFSNSDIMEKRNGQYALEGIELPKPITHLNEFIGTDSAIDGPKWGITRFGDRFTDIGNYLVTATDKELYIDGVKITDVNSKIDGISHQGKYFFVDGDKLKVYGSYPKIESTYIKIIGDVPEKNVLLEIVPPPDNYTPLGKHSVSEASIVTVKKIKFVGGLYEVLLDDDEKWYELIYDGNINIQVGNEYIIEYDDDKKPTKVKLRHIEEGDSHITGITVYDYEKGKVWYEPCEFEIEDEYKGANVIPKNLKFIVSHKGRLFVSGDREDDDNIFISDVENPYYFAVGLPIQIPPTSDRITGLITYDDSIIIGRERDIYSLAGETNRLDLGLELFHLKKLNTHTGFINNTSANHVHNYLFFIGSDGNAYALSSSNNEYRVLATQLINNSINFAAQPISLSLGDVREAVTCFHGDNWYISMDSKVLVYSYRHKAWTMLNGINARSFCVISDVLYWGNDDGKVASFSDDYLDFGQPFLCHWSSKFFDLDEPSIEKYFKEFNTISEGSDVFNTDLYVSFNIDHYDTGEAVLLTPIEPDKSRVNNVNYLSPYRINRRGRNIRFTFRNGIKGFGEVDYFLDLWPYPREDGIMVYVKSEDVYYLYHTFHETDNFCESWDMECVIRKMGWVKIGKLDLNQTMKILKIDFNYETRGGRSL